MRKLLVVFVGVGMLAAAPAGACTVAENVSVTAGSQQVRLAWVAPKYANSFLGVTPMNFHVRVWKTNEEANWFRNPGITVSTEYPFTAQQEKEHVTRELPKERMFVTYRPEPSGEYRAFFSGEELLSTGGECWEMTKEFGPLIVP